ncbi:MAG: AMP-binding protein [Deltaproteobacteria bacterium]|jgi:acyl-CoA synthetase (AMP-forming)/AMP-acid ligase II|nr:AMP-binding protein [Deltaproteobacteria bacterium]
MDIAANTDAGEIFNVASLLTESAKSHPDRVAVKSRRGPDTLGRSFLTYAQLDRDSSILGQVLGRGPLEVGDRVVVMVPPGSDFFVVIFGLFKAGLVPVMVDPGMGLKRMLLCLSESKPRGLIGVKRAQLGSLLMPRYFTGIKQRITLGSRFFWGGQSFRKILLEGAGPENLPGPVATLADQAAGILFTSGATGLAKGTIYTHAMFRAQVKLIRETYGLTEGGIDLATFPLFSLFSTALGLTAVIPNMNPVKPGKTDPRKILVALNEENCTSVFASPALLSRLTSYATENKITFGTLKRVISAGAPIVPKVAIDFANTMGPEGRLFTPYGATEGMPLTSIDSREIAQVRGMNEQGFGVCVGKVVADHQMAVIPISDAPLTAFTEEQKLPMGEVGEFVAQGPVVALNYFERPKETALSLTKGPDGQIWRRMGDLGWQDAQGRMWFCGRKSQRVVSGKNVFFTISCEAIFNNHPKVLRSALVGVGPAGQAQPVMIIEPRPKRLSAKAWTELVEELKALGRINPRTMAIKLFLLYRNFPVDIRHNAKINREKLALWAANHPDLNLK